jgi:hypothetical protein
MGVEVNWWREHGEVVEGAGGQVDEHRGVKAKLGDATLSPGSGQRWLAPRALMPVSGRAEMWRGVHVDEGEMGETVLCSTLHEDKAAITWGGGHQQRMVTTMSLHTVSLAHARVTGVSRLSGRCSWQVGPSAFLIFSRFSIFWNLKSISVTFPMSKIHQILHKDS